MASTAELTEWASRLESHLPESVPTEGEPLERAAFLSTLKRLFPVITFGPNYRRAVMTNAATSVRMFDQGRGAEALYWLVEASKGSR